jgi:hypothetical protein
VSSSEDIQQQDTQGSQGFINRPTGPVHQHFGDTVGRDKISGDIQASDIPGKGIAIGHGAQATVYETYPAASLALLNHRQAIAYKKTRSEKAIFRAGQWNDTAVGRLANTLHLVADDEDAFTHDDLDAAICAITGVVEEPFLLQRDELAREIAGRFKEKVPTSYAAKIRTDPPDGYVLLKEWPQQEIRLTKQNLATSATPLADVIS